MPVLKLLRSAPVRYALAFTGLSTLLMGALLAVIYGWMISLLERHLDENIEEETRVLRHDFGEGGREAVLRIVRRHAEGRRDSPLHLLVQDGAGRVVAGDLPPMPAVDGWQTVHLTPPAAEGGRSELRVRGERFDDETFVLVSHDTVDLRQSRELIVRSFSTALGVQFVLALGGGLAIGAALLKRVDNVNRTARAIMGGDLSRRVPVTGSGDELGGLTENLNRMLERIEELMENLRHVSSNVAHDLRTPLGRLRQRLEACRLRPRSRAEYEAAIDGAIEETDALLKTFDAMLRIAQIEASARRVRFVGVDLAGVAENVVEAFTAVAEDDAKHLRSEIDPAVTVHGDRALLTQMLANLTENALRHTPPGTRVAVRLEQRLEGPRLTISDDGPGIPADERERVFRRFYRVDASRSTPGSGLGLSLVAAVAKLHDASIALEDNAPGLRAVVTFPPPESPTAPSRA